MNNGSRAVIHHLASGFLSLEMPSRLGRTLFPLWARWFCRRVGGRVEEKTATPEMTIWELTIEGEPMRLVWEKFPMGITLESESEGGDKIIQRLHSGT